MPIPIQCSKCGATYTVPDDRAGRTGRCKCGELIQVPAAVPPPAQTPVAPPTPQPSPGPEASPVVVPQPATPLAARRRGLPLWLKIVAACSVLIVLLGGTVVVLHLKGVRPPRLPSKTERPKASPEKTTTWVQAVGGSLPLKSGSARGEITSVDTTPDDRLRLRVHYTWSGERGPDHFVYGFAEGADNIANLESAAKFFGEVWAELHDVGGMQMNAESAVVAVEVVDWTADAEDPSSYSADMRLQEMLGTEVSGTGLVAVQAFDLGAKPPTPVTNAYYFTMTFDEAGKGKGP